jgi:3-dehydroquinate synthase
VKALEIKSTGYSVFLSSDFYELTNNFFSGAKNKYSNYVVLLDENSSKHCLTPLLIEIDYLKDALFIEIESGEKNKNINTCSRIWEQLANFKADRKTLFINLGGGVICDLGGFAASTYKRGIDFVNFPTTLLAQVDASVGGKVGIDLEDLKNAVGLFSNPKAVFIYPPFLTTLAKKQVQSGFAEIIKHALITEGDYWNTVTSFNFSTANFQELIHQSVKIKNQIIKQDFQEMNIRKSLNFGHTIGHALESYSLKKDKNPLLHGEAIAIGMLCESYISTKILGLSKKEFDAISSYLIAHFKPFKINSSAYETLLNLMRNDKKNSDNKINFSLLESIGKCQINCNCPDELILESLDFYRKKRG